MATRFYFGADAEETPISPTPNPSWDDTSILVRALTKTAKRGLALTNVVFTTTVTLDRDILFRQYISDELEPGQSIHGAQAVKMQCLIRGSDQGYWQAVSVLRLYVWNQTTTPKERKTIVSITRDDVDADVNVLTNRSLFVTSQAGDYYPTVAGDRLVVEIGLAQYLSE